MKHFKFKFTKLELKFILNLYQNLLSLFFISTFHIFTQMAPGFFFFYEMISDQMHLVLFVAVPSVKLSFAKPNTLML